MLYEQGYHNHSGYANIRIHCLTAFQPMNAENIASHCNHGKNLGQFDCRAFRNYILQEVRPAGNYVSKGKRSQKSSTQKDDLQIHSICSLSLGFFFFFFLRLGLPEEVLITLQIPSSNLTSFSSSYPKHNWIPIFLRHLAPRLFLAVNYNYSGI